MESPRFQSLTERQRQVLERIDRRMPIKVVAADLGVSESRINQHIRALKDIYGAGSLNDLCEAYRCETQDIREAAPCRKSVSRTSEVPRTVRSVETEDRVAPGEFVLADVAPLAIEAPWTVRTEPRLVPGVLDGDHAVLYRLAVIVGLALAFIVLVVLVVTAALSMSEATGGATYGPEDQTVQGAASDPPA